MQVLADDGARIDVRVDGASGPPIVMLAGFPLTREIWNAQAESLARTYRIVRPDLRGTGESSVPPGPYLMETLAGDVAAAMDALGIARAALVGHSLGGYVALAFARMFSERVSHLALVCSRLDADSPQRAAGRRTLADRVERFGADELRDAYLPLLAGTEAPDGVRAAIAATIEAFDPVGAAALLRGMALRAPADDIAPDLDIPVAIVAGARDATAELAYAREVAGAFTDASLTVCERSGHVPMLEEPGRVCSAIAELLDRRLLSG